MRFDNTLKTVLRERNVPVRSMWRMPGPPDTAVDGMECLLINGVPCIVQTYTGNNGWEVYVPSRVVDTMGTIDEVMRRVGAT